MDKDLMLGIRRTRAVCFVGLVVVGLFTGISLTSSASTPAAKLIGSLLTIAFILGCLWTSVRLGWPHLTRADHRIADAKQLLARGQWVEGLRAASEAREAIERVVGSSVANEGPNFEAEVLRVNVLVTLGMAQIANGDRQAGTTLDLATFAMRSGKFSPSARINVERTIETLTTDILSDRSLTLVERRKAVQHAFANGL